MNPPGTYTGGVQPPVENEWSTGFCDCCSDCGHCCLTYWCPCITFGQIAEIVDQGTTSCGTAGALCTLVGSVIGCAFIYTCSYRNKLRRQYNLKGDNCTDCLAHACCMVCALTQEYRELTNRGYDVPLGWHENTRRQNQKVVMGTPPVVPMGMSR